LAALMDGRSLPAGELAFIGNVAPQTASFHLGKLLESQLIKVERQGKHRYYRLANEQVALAIESLASIAPWRKDADARSYQHSSYRADPALQLARSCYRHLAGRLAIQVHDALLARRFVRITGEKQYELTGPGERWLTSLPSAGEVGISRREHLGRPCLDWTERHHHIGGPLGVALLARFTNASWLAVRPETRALRLTLKGREGLDRQLGVR